MPYVVVRRPVMSLLGSKADEVMIVGSPVTGSATDKAEFVPSFA
jgi:hypothetical protein